MSKNNGGPAFPVSTSEWNDYEKHPVDIARGGISKRDYFAGQALIGVIARVQSPSTAQSAVDAATRMSLTIEQVFAGMAYEIADAMLKEREKL